MGPKTIKCHTHKTSVTMVGKFKHWKARMFQWLISHIYLFTKTKDIQIKIVNLLNSRVNLHVEEIMPFLAGAYLLLFCRQEIPMFCTP